ncbi:hypothetical protein [Pseudalkalibacillus berkeleyi]|uniref:Uncharacterized protein n=1 Tax=Pseudalkalibacillus berkeleyi TaxID=1069813 RepID=A0ABS9H3W5_9BACL|nr:hypothetical protein [Pseudalkalibacillus berkeleyi]MCF6138488.1 hypothetical protein [Pseudalkalibacillus berkeleyi]
MTDKIIMIVLVYLLLLFTRMLDHTKNDPKESRIYYGIVLFSGYLSYLFITGTDGFNINDLLDWPFEMPARAVLNFFTS